MLDYDDLCLCCGTIAHASFSELVEAAAAGGFRSISIWPHHYQDACAQGLSDQDLKLMLEDHGLSISELDPLMNWLPPAALGLDPDSPATETLGPGEDFFYQIADALGARHLNVVQAFGPRLETEMVVEAFAGVCDRAAQHGLKVSLEFLPWSGIPDIKTAGEIVRQAGRPNGGINLDTWHLHRSGGSVDDLTGLPADAVVAMQINDAAAESWADVIEETMQGRLLPGHGVIDLPGVFRALDTIGCMAPIGVEVFSDELLKLPPVEAARKAGDAIRTVLVRART
ncbi:MAG: sugar phosphate isomerase/epimerase [Chloroflexi bacterium]|nr:sugar phosphate isomerase/epimerase [Chloroflexota bacterium]